MPSAVLDTVVFVRALINPFSIWGRLVFGLSDGYRLIVSRPVVIEILEVLGRPDLRSKFRTLADLDRARVLEILSRAEAVELGDIARICRDPNDDKLLATADAARANYLVSEDRDLLDLGQYRGTEILTASRFVELLQRGNERGPRP